MNVFSFRDRLIADYYAYVKSFMRFDREDLRSFVDEALAAGALWPDAHRRVRTASGAQGAFKIEENPPDLLGLAIYLPVPSR
jgi:hypothetical protein